MVEGIRWVEIKGLEAHGDIVRGVIPGFSSFMDKHFKLQYLDLQGVWRDVEIASPASGATCIHGRGPTCPDCQAEQASALSGGAES